MKYYAIADLHGRYDLFTKALDAIEKDAGEPYKVITLGDYIDRGPQSKEIITDLMLLQSAEFICLAGNHEAMMVETVRTPLDPNWWIGNGGDTTLWSYGSKVKSSQYYGFPPIGYDPHVVPIEHVDWMANLPLYYETEKQVFVHAGIPNSDAPLEKQDKEKMQWMLYSKDDPGWWMGKHVVHGHHQFADGPHSWAGRTDLDCFAWHEGRLVIGVFDDTQGPAIKYLEVLGGDYGVARNMLGP